MSPETEITPKVGDKVSRKPYGRIYRVQAGQSRGGFGGASLEQECRVKTVTGRISGETLKEWKEEANFAAA
jgi:hypothetical protein